MKFRIDKFFFDVVNYVDYSLHPCSRMSASDSARNFIIIYFYSYSRYRFQHNTAPVLLLFLYCLKTDDSLSQLPVIGLSDSFNHLKNFILQTNQTIGPALEHLFRSDQILVFWSGPRSMPPFTTAILVQTKQGVKV